MPKRIVIIQGHPDPAGGHYGHALAEAYAAGARRGGHEVRTVDVANLDFPVLRTPEEWKTGATPADVIRAQNKIAWAEHLVILYPLWLGAMPALLKAFFEQTLRPGFAIGDEKEGITWKKQLTGRSARVVVTMGMPAFVYRWYFRAHSLKSLERNILAFCGIGPIRETLIGTVEGKDASKRERWLREMEKLGERGG